MRLAICLYGLVGNLVGKSGYNSLGRESALELGFDHLSEFFSRDHEVDFFIHSWEGDLSERIIDLYQPKEYLFEDQKKFEIPKYVIGSEKRCQNVYSRWYSQMMSNKLLDRQIDSGLYDYVVSSRFDIGWKKKIDFESLNKDILYYPGGISNARKILDYWFVANVSNMHRFCKLFDSLDEYNMPGKKDEVCSLNKKLGISPHRLAKFHLKKLGMQHEPLLWQNHWIDQADSDFPILRNIYFS